RRSRTAKGRRTDDRESRRRPRREADAVADPARSRDRIDSVDVTFDIDTASGTIEVRAIVRCEGKTGVEMEAMTACAVAPLTIYDMCKSAEKGITIESLQLVRKSGGKSGLWER